MPRIIRFNLQFTVHHHRLVQCHRNHFLHAILNHLRREKILIALLLHRHLAHILQQNRRDCLRGMRHVNRPRVPHHLGHVGQRPTVVQMEVGYDDTVDEGCYGALGGDVRKIGEAALVVVAHVHAAVEHDVLAAH